MISLSGLTPELSRPAAGRRLSTSVAEKHPGGAPMRVRLERFVGRDVARNPQPPQTGCRCRQSLAAWPRGESLSALPSPKQPPGHAQSRRELIELTEDGKARTETKHARWETNRRTERRAEPQS